MSEHPLCCDATFLAERPCTGWDPSGWKWHGCAKPIGHGRGLRRYTHRCRCGFAWTGNRLHRDRSN